MGDVSQNQEFKTSIHCLHGGGCRSADPRACQQDALVVDEDGQRRWKCACEPCHQPLVAALRVLLVVLFEVLTGQEATMPLGDLCLRVQGLPRVREDLRRGWLRLHWALWAALETSEPEEKLWQDLVSSQAGDCPILGDALQALEDELVRPGFSWGHGSHAEVLEVILDRVPAWSRAVPDVNYTLPSATITSPPSTTSPEYPWR